jgi:hypothetical protein
VQYVFLEHRQRTNPEAAAGLTGPIKDVRFFRFRMIRNSENLVHTAFEVAITPGHNSDFLRHSEAPTYQCARFY